MQDLPALRLSLISRCQPCLFLTHFFNWIPAKNLSLLFLTMSFVSAPCGFCLPAPVAVWCFGVSFLLTGLFVLRIVVWSLVLFKVSFPVPLCGFRINKIALWSSAFFFFYQWVCWVTLLCLPAQFKKTFTYLELLTVLLLHSLPVDSAFVAFTGFLLRAPHSPPSPQRHSIQNCTGFHLPAFNNKSHYQLCFPCSASGSISQILNSSKK